MPKMTRRQYAETVLDVHGVLEQADARYDEHGTALTHRNALLREIRDIKEEIEIRELEIIEAGDPSGVSATAWKELIKNETRSDPKHRELSAKLSHRETELTAAEGQLRHAELGCRLLAARMHELGGLLFFYGPPNEED